MQKTAVIVYKSKNEVIEKFIGKNDVVLDVGFWGQAVKRNDPQWTHGLLKVRTKEVFGIDLDYDESKLNNPEHYIKASAENFRFDSPSGRFDVIFASELIEHLSNPGKFLEMAKKHLKPNGRLIITTPNAFSLFSLLSKLIRSEPIVNPDHTMYFNIIVLTTLLEKNGFRVEEVGFIDVFPKTSSLKRHSANVIRVIVQFFTPKYLETLVVIATSR